MNVPIDGSRENTNNSVRYGGVNEKLNRKSTSNRSAGNCHTPQGAGRA